MNSARTETKTDQLTSAVRVLVYLGMNAKNKSPELILFSSEFWSRTWKNKIYVFCRFVCHIYFFCKRRKCELHNVQVKYNLSFKLRFEVFKAVKVYCDLFCDIFSFSRI
jgi:hypothetical protein